MEGIVLFGLFASFFAAPYFALGAIWRAIRKKPSWKPWAMGAAVSALVLIATGISARSQQHMRDAEVAAKKAAEDQQEQLRQADLRAQELAEAAKPPRQKFKECLDAGSSINQCRVTQGDDEYADYLRSGGMTEINIKNMLNLPDR